MEKPIFKNQWTYRYSMALLVIAILLIISNFTTYWIIETEKESSSLINQSGRQRMLAKKIALLGTQLVNCEAPTTQEALKADILNAVNQMENSHDNLINRDIHHYNYSPAVKALYFKPPIAVDTQVRRYISEARSLVQTANGKSLEQSNPHYQKIIKAVSGELSESLDAVVNQFQRDSEAKILMLQNIETGALVIVLVVLLIEALYIFRPMIRTIEEEKEKLIKLNKELKNLSFRDGLTQIYNRRYLDEFLQGEWERSIREKTSLAFIILDIDYFKAFNDTYGHQAGDDCLKQVAQRMTETVKRPTDLVARYGGEEFAIILTNTDCEGARTVAEALRSDIEALKIEHSKSAVSDVVTVSLGVVTGVPNQNLELIKLIAIADEALYKAKNTGRNRVVMSDFCSD